MLVEGRMVVVFCGVVLVLWFGLCMWYVVYVVYGVRCEDCSDDSTYGTG